MIQHILAVMVLAAPPVQQAQSAPQILKRAEQVYAATTSMQADFVQDLRVPLLGTSQRSRGTLYLRRPDRFLMRFTDPAGDRIVADGRHFWMYYPSSDRKQVLRAPIKEGFHQADFQREFLSDPSARYFATVTGSEAVGGRRTHVLRLVPRRTSSYKQVRLWVDAADFTVRRFEMTEENESVRRVELSNIRRNIQLADNLFRFVPPAGTHVFDQ
jgi:outer membrane lipoprotein carrier protein